MPELDPIFRERFQRLRERLLKVPEHSFDLATFSQIDYDVLLDVAKEVEAKNLRGVEADKVRAKALLAELNKAYSGQRCGTTACVVGWLPILLPEEFVYFDHHLPAFKSDPARQVGIEDLAEWLGLPESWGEDLFTDDGRPYNDLSRKASIHDVLNAVERAITEYELCEEDCIPTFLPETISIDD